MKPDPCPYDGDLADVHGRRPYNGHLWPTEWYWMREDGFPQANSMWNIGIIALADGRFSSHMGVWAMERNNAQYDWQSDKPPIKCVFETRGAALRAAAARTIRLARNARHWPKTGLVPPFGGKVTCSVVVEWARGIVARESGKPAPPPRKFFDRPPAPATIKTGLPLFDLSP